MVSFAFGTARWKPWCSSCRGYLAIIARAAAGDQEEQQEYEQQDEQQGDVKERTREAGGEENLATLT